MELTPPPDYERLLTNLKVTNPNRLAMFGLVSRVTVLNPGVSGAGGGEAASGSPERPKQALSKAQLSPPRTN